MEGAITPSDKDISAGRNPQASSAKKPSLPARSGSSRAKPSRAKPSKVKASTAGKAGPTTDKSGPAAGAGVSARTLSSPGKSGSKSGGKSGNGAIKAVIVESPAKAKTILKFLGPGFRIIPSLGHVRDLPKSDFGVEVNGGVTVKYETLAKAKKFVAELRKVLKGASELWLATDPDREGEAIAWHVASIAGMNDDEVHRVTFTEITKDAVQQAFKNPRPIDDRLVSAQQARRIVDRIVGYKLSPVLWHKVQPGLSAGRVQSAALRLVVAREKDIRQFEQREYWSLEALFDTDGKNKVPARCPWREKDKFALPDEASARGFLESLNGATWTVEKVEKRQVKKNPAPPFITSTLQQEASRKLSMSPARTMRIAQQLYEGVDIGSEGSVGLITYMRTDSTRLAPQAIQEISDVVRERFGPEYVLAKPRSFRAKAKGAQEAHEGVRPTSAARHPEVLEKLGGLDRDQLRLYTLIWQRAVSSQMPEALFDAVAVDIVPGVSGAPVRMSETNHALFRANGQTVRFDGFMRVYVEGQDEAGEELHTLPELVEGQTLRLDRLDPSQHFTEPPPRFSQATLVREMERLGIGRPSTYAPTIETLESRGYVEQENRRLIPTELGFVVTDMLEKHFAAVVDYEFTARMEEDLDRIAEGELEWEGVVKGFYSEFVRHLEEQKDKIEKPAEPTEEVCEQCSRPMLKKWGRHGWFLSCSGFPECRNAKPLPGSEPDVEQPSGEKCPKCGEGDLIVRRSRYGPFVGCNRYPECDYKKSVVKEIGVDCPECKQGRLVVKKTRRGKTFYGCNRYPDCEFALWERPLEQPCPSCAGVQVVKGSVARCTSCGTQHELAAAAPA